MTLHDDQRIRLGDNTMWRNLGGEAVLLQLDAGVYFGLNEVGADALARIDATTTFGKLRQELLALYDVDEPTLSADLAALLEDMQRRGLIVIEPPSDQPHATA